jgi:hypothetical protein
VPSRHNTPCHRHDNRAVANTTRYPEGGTSRTLTGPEGTRGLTEGAGRAGGNEARRERAKPKQPHTPKAKTSKATEEETTATTKGQQEPATPRRHHKGSTQTKKHRTQRDNQSRPKQITGRKIRAPAHHPEKDNGQGRHQGDIRPTSQPQRQEAKINTTTKRNELRSTSAPAQSADRHTSTKRIKIYLCGGRTEAKVRVYLSSLRACTQACTQVQKRSRP